MPGSEYTLGLISKVRDQARALNAHPIPWPRDQVYSLYGALQASTLATRLDINNSLPVNNLPHEVLSYVFELACSPPSAASMAFKAALTHVCRYWRDVLLSYPKIWANIFARRDTVDFFSECIFRSRTLPLHGNFHYHMGWDSPSGCSCEYSSSLASRRVRCPHVRARKTTELFGQHGVRGRLQSLDLLIFFSEMAEGGFEELEHVGFFTLPLPELQTFRLVCLDAAQSREEFIIHDKVFSRELPKLQNLSLVHCWGGLTSWITGLTSFHLEFRHSWDVPSAEFIDFLEHNRQTLEVLSLDNVGASDPDQGYVTLTNLKELKLRRIADPLSLFSHFALPKFKNLTTLRVRSSNGTATFSATNDAGVVLQVIENQEDLFSCCTDRFSLHWWTQIATLDLDLDGLEELTGSDVEELYHGIPSLETMEIRGVLHTRKIFRPLLPTKEVLHPSLRLLRLRAPLEIREEVFAALTTVTYGRKAVGCVVWDVEFICNENCEDVSDQWTVHCEKSYFCNPEIVKFRTDPGFLGRERNFSEDLSVRTLPLPGASILKDTSDGVRERVLANRENLSSQVEELIELSKSHHDRENLSRIADHVENMRVGVGRLQNEVASIHKLPHALLQLVFHHACLSDQHTTSRTAAALSHVCCQWRTMLLSTPQFWCDVAISGHDTSFPAACLARSSNLPLNVTVQFNYVAPPINPRPRIRLNVFKDEDVRQRLDECREGLTLLEAERDRIHQLHVNYILLGSNHFQAEIMEHSFFTNKLKNLRELVWNYDDKQGILALPHRTFGGSLESLRRIRLENAESSMGQFPNLTSLECIRVYDTDCVAFMRGRMPEFFSQNTSIQSLQILEFHIYDTDSPQISMDNLTSLRLDRVFRWYLLFELLHIKNMDGGAFTKISFSNQGAWIAFSAVNSIGFSLAASISPCDDPEEDDFLRRYFAGVALIRVEDFQTIYNTERLFSVLRIFGNAEGDAGRLELHSETGPHDLYPQVTVFAKQFLPRLGTLAVYLHLEKSWGWRWVRVMVDDLFNPEHHVRLPDECVVEVYRYSSGVFLSSSVGELRAGVEGRRQYGGLGSRPLLL